MVNVPLGGEPQLTLASGLSSYDTGLLSGGDSLPRFSEDSHSPSIAGLGVRTLKPDDNSHPYGTHKFRKDRNFQVKSS